MNEKLRYNIAGGYFCLLALVNIINTFIKTGYDRGEIYMLPGLGGLFFMAMMVLPALVYYLLQKFSQESQRMSLKIFAGSAAAVLLLTVLAAGFDGDIWHSLLKPALFGAMSVFALIMLSCDAFKKRTSQNIKNILVIIYLIPAVFFNLRFYGFTFSYRTHMLINIAALVLFLLAVYLLMQRPGETKRENDNREYETQLARCREMLKQGALTEEEFKKMAEKLKKG